MVAVGRELGISGDIVRRVIEREGVSRRRGYLPLQQSITIPTDSEALARTAALWESRGSLVWLRKTTNASSARFAIRAPQEILEWLRAAFGSGNVYPHGRSGKPIRSGQWELNRTRDTVVLLEAILPYLTTKRHTAIEAIRKMRGFLIPSDPPAV
jgi:hypothetical protein